LYMFIRIGHLRFACFRACTAQVRHGVLPHTDALISKTANGYRKCFV
jgi:hypothetical protein